MPQRKVKDAFRTTVKQVFSTVLSSCRRQLLRTVEKTEKHFQQVGQREHATFELVRICRVPIADSTLYYVYVRLFVFQFCFECDLQSLNFLDIYPRRAPFDVRGIT